MQLTAKNITYLAMLTAVLVLLQSLGAFGVLSFGKISINLTLVPIMIGVVVLGVWAGLFLGFVSCIVVTIYALTGVDVFSNLLIEYKLFLTIALIFVKGCVAPFVASLVYKAFAKKSELVGTWVAFIVCPIVNTAIFCLGMLLFYKSFLVATFGGNVMYIVFITLAGINFLVELAINIVCAPIVYRVNKIIK